MPIYYAVTGSVPLTKKQMAAACVVDVDLSVGSSGHEVIQEGFQKTRTGLKFTALVKVQDPRLSYRQFLKSLDVELMGKKLRGARFSATIQAVD